MIFCSGKSQDTGNTDFRYADIQRCPGRAGRKILAAILLNSLFFIPGVEAQLKARPRVFHMGRVQEGLHVPVKFTLYNSGARPVRIEEVRTFASCVQRRPVHKPELAPGDSLLLEYTFESLGYGGARIDKKIEVYFNGEESPMILRVQGEIQALESHQVSLGELVYNYFVLVDIRPEKEFRKEHLIGAVNISAERLEKWLEANRSRLSEEMIIYVCSRDGSESERIVREIRRTGFLQCVSLTGGIQEWKNRHGNKWLVSGVW